MLKRILTAMYGAMILSSVTVYIADAQLFPKRCYTCGSDLCEQLLKIKGNLLKGDGVRVECNAVADLDNIETICLSPTGRLAPGSPPTHREVGGIGVVDDSLCTKADREKGKCPVTVVLATEPHDYSSQEAFEAFWGIAESCNHNWTPIYVLQRISTMTASWYKDGELQGTVVASCEYPFEEIQAETTNNNTFLDFIPVEAPCTVISQ